jgi:carboxylesterase
MMGGTPVGTIERAGSAPAVLALHGFGATPHEVLLAVEVAQSFGLRALAPLLPGHGSSVYDLAETRWYDWQRSADEGLRELTRGAEPAIVVGSSMGSLLALDLAARFPERVRGVVALAPATRLPWPFPSLALALVCGLGIRDFTTRKGGVDIRDPELRRTQITYDRQPAYAGNEVRLAGRRVESRLGSIRCPALIMHGQHDHVCPVSNARRVYQKLGTPSWEKELVILPRSFHIITRDVEADVVRAHLEKFVAGLLAAQGESRRAQVPVDPYPPRPRAVSDRL